MDDKLITCTMCDKEFIWTVGEQRFYKIKEIDQPKKCKQCKSQEKALETEERLDGHTNGKLIDQEKIIKFVRLIEDTKGFKRDLRLVFSHLVEEVGELSRAMYAYEKAIVKSSKAKPDGIISELIDIIFLALYLADILAEDVNDLIPERMKEIREQYGVK